MAYEYKGCGIENIFLENGYIKKSTPYGEGVVIENLPGLHRAIGLYLAERPKKLKGKEFRFLRQEMDLSQKRFGQLFNYSEQQVAKWEKGKSQLPAWADRVIRVLYLERVGERNRNLSVLLDFLKDLDEKEVRRVTFKESESKWEIIDAA